MFAELELKSLELLKLTAFFFKILCYQFKAIKTGNIPKFY